MKTLILILFLCVLSLSCITTNRVADNDDLYFSKANRDSVVRIRTYRYYQPLPPYQYDYNDYWFWRWNSPLYNNWNRPNVIIIQPKQEPAFKYEKRPDREGNGGVAVPLPRRRGRN